ncbi:MAG: acetate kinase [Oscillospiraceae bacterium]|jgi:acetate kinase|nr:acetate kinase [Oscillospiraceae bacterium]
MKILAINVGSSTLKYRLIDMSSEIIIAKGMCCGIGSCNGTVSYENRESSKIKITCKLSGYEEVLRKICNILLDKKIGIISSLEEIFAVGHRIVHGGAIFKQSVLIDSRVIKKIESLSCLAPLHNKVQAEAIKACQKVFGNEKKEVAVFDTAFHSTMPPSAYTFPIPYEYCEKYKIRRYGFHGLSHKFVSEKYAKITGKDIKRLKLITCHLGSGSSVAAIENSCVVDTSMGFTPLDGLMMATRSGSIDPSIVTFLQKEKNISADQVNEILNKKSGFLGISGISDDARNVRREANNGDKRAILACEMLKHQLVKLIGGYISVMNGCDGIIFTAGIGENHWILRHNVLRHFAYLGLKIDESLNKNTITRKQGRISTHDSEIDVFVIPTNEELMVARDTQKVAKLNTKTTDTA